MATTGAARAKQVLAPKCVTVTISKAKANSLKIKVSPGSTVIFENQDGQDYWIRIRADRKGRVIPVGIPVSANGSASLTVDPWAKRGSLGFEIVASGSTVPKNGPIPPPHHDLVVEKSL